MKLLIHVLEILIKMLPFHARFEGTIKVHGRFQSGVRLLIHLAGVRPPQVDGNILLKMLQLANQAVGPLVDRGELLLAIAVRLPLSIRGLTAQQNQRQSAKGQYLGNGNGHKSLLTNSV